jgi:Carboxypeptidase regulatory-like domain
MTLVFPRELPGSGHTGRRPATDWLKARCVPWLLLLLVACSASLPAARAQLQAVRLVQGVVRGSNDQPQANAVVYLQDQKSLEVRTYITEADGHYRFGQMSSEVDYQLWAEFKGHKSKTRSISSFDSKKELTFDLKIDTSK